MENDEGISRVDAMFVFSDLQVYLRCVHHILNTAYLYANMLLYVQADILQVLHAILSLSTVPSSMPLLQSAPHLLPHLFTYLYAHCTFHSETRCLTSFSANLSTLCNVLSALGHWIRIFPTSVVKMLTEYEKIHAHRHVCVELWIYVNSSLVLTQDPTSTLLASSQASKTGTSAISPLDAELMFDAVHSVMVTYLTSLAPYMSTSVRQQISSQMFIVLQYVSNLLHASAVNDSVRMHRQRVFTDYVPRILELAYLDLTLYPQPCVPTSNLLLLQEIVGRLKCSSLGMGRGAAVWGCIEVGIAGLLFPSQVVLPGAGKVEDIVAKLIQQQQEEAGAAQVEGKRGHSGSVMEAEEQEKKKVRLEDLVSFSSSPSAPLPPALPSSPAERDEKEKAQVANKPSLSEPSMQTTKAAASSSIKPPVQEEDDDDDDLPDINLDDD
ncbi:hypothetical protein EON65_36000 [archaeon]|nr:MAG: hypothetical protein EON65_36000 [archaeon]